MKALKRSLAILALAVMSVASPIASATSIISTNTLGEFTDTGSDISKVAAATVGISSLVFAIRGIRRVL